MGNDPHAGCEQYKFLWGRDHAMLNTDYGLYKNFTVDINGYPGGCAGLEDFAMKVLHPVKNAWPNGWEECGKQEYAPEGTALSAIVEEFAADQQAWIDAFIPAMEKYMEAGYGPRELTAITTAKAGADN